MFAKKDEAPKYAGHVSLCLFGQNLRVLISDMSHKPSTIPEKDSLLYFSRAFYISKNDDDVDTFLANISKLDRRAVKTSPSDLGKEIPALIDDINNAFKRIAIPPPF